MSMESHFSALVVSNIGARSPVEATVDFYLEFFKKMDKKIHILVVDDEHVMRSLLTDVLEDRGYKVQSVYNGKDALDVMKDNFFEIVFIDVHMPVMDGIQALKAIKKLSPKTEIVMMDSYPDDQMLRPEAKDVVSCITKPFNIKQITDIVEVILNRKGSNT